MIWFVFMVLFAAALVLPLAQELGYARHHLTRALSVLSGIAGILIAGLLVSVFLAYVGFQSYGTAGALVMGFAGAVSSVLLVIVLSTISAANDNKPAHAHKS